MLYTSGSTGKPKGVELEHRNVVHFVDATMRLHPYDGSMRALLVASFTFDAHVESVFPTFAGGGRLVALPATFMLQNMNAVLQDYEISHFVCTPSHLTLASSTQAPFLKAIKVGGEAIPPGVVEAWTHGTEFINFYGPTEAACATVAMTCTADMAYPFSIGTPFHNVRAYIVDSADPSILMPPAGLGAPIVQSTGADTSAPFLRLIVPCVLVLPSPSKLRK